MEANNINSVCNAAVKRMLSLVAWIREERLIDLYMRDEC